MSHSLTATYAAPSTPSTPSKSFAHALPPCPSAPSTSEKTAYLSALRQSVVALQAEVNEFLTAKMEEEKAGASTAGGELHGGALSGGRDRDAEEEEEDGYGEEKVEE
ncbi:hypothetical protein W97_07003 [Coniosporium apollinis CBS 100218]|uniref:EKC/KEOPS complex subunit GON7 n=1 Tax=Coniosporium apollinis (strain CBS 100218) TaxID=1168221 RepID=R7Z134_CONA1|nr:uncharacterized protein W97_07003 [Coniosporium apollinis CBS 100218]EON67749.1 hypothetical protein W97_07003 [Coniosporium apollinis CBS 100218]